MHHARTLPPTHAPNLENMSSELAKGFFVLTKEHLRLHLWPQLASTQILHSCAMQSCSSRCCGKTHTFVAGTVFALVEKNQVHEGSERSYFMLFQAWRARLKLWCPKLLGLLSKKFHTFVAKADWLSKWRSDSSWSMWHRLQAPRQCRKHWCHVTVSAAGPPLLSQTELVQSHGSTEGCAFCLKRRWIERAKQKSWVPTKWNCSPRRKAVEEAYLRLSLASVDLGLKVFAKTET